MYRFVDHSAELELELEAESAEGRGSVVRVVERAGLARLVPIGVVKG